MKNIIYLLVFASCFACDADMADGGDRASVGDQNGGEVSTSGSLNEQSLNSYIKVFNQLKSEVSDVLELVNENEPSAAQHSDFSRLQSIIQDNGMSYDGFVSMSSKIGTIYSISEANMETYQEISDMNDGAMDEMISSIQEMIDDPDVPEAQKGELRKSLQEAKSGKAQLGNMFEQNKEKAEKMYKKIRKKLGKIATESEVRLVNQHEKELEAAYDGISRPRIEG
ncbi:MAG: hypothetical protein GY810_26235 [Aureispira sp.]|nr:hypothetical protein [Aureispira sp.]